MAVGYRVGVYGFLGGAELRKEGEEDAMEQGAERKNEGKDGAWGNYGLWDQREALRWLRRFGKAMDADLKRVTLAGMSAGAYSVHAQVVSCIWAGKGMG
jgi:carboxylesterase type B